ncbi:MAG TPA: TonB-dependent receptor [Hymenobacter sp.]|uniref:TonB-dependent receptor domain-containing protein n=1 Tax=Hymenobacter sp. TaxID=1898978 RepID=UPI002D7F59A2|nr:TonB-dependent receptor [Hymenobacter sp.]HET9503250.1 TonB-dependent receptor [Hymenobacter sp.]
MHCFSFFWRQPSWWLLLLLGWAVRPASAQTSLAQARLTGTVVDSLTQQPVPFASVGLRGPDGQVVAGVTTDENGLFGLNAPTQPGIYQLIISSLGYQSAAHPVPVTGGQRDLGRLRLRPAAQALGEVVVKGRPPLLEQRGDRLVYHANQDLTNHGGSALEVLRKAPLLSVTPTGQVQLRGSSSVKVLLNGQPSGLMARNLRQALKLIPASSIQTVEVITAPSSAYDAEGAGGVINIITKKPVRGPSASAEATLGNFNQELTGSYSTQRGRLGFTLAGSLSSERERSATELTRQTLQEEKIVGELKQQRRTDNTWRGWSTDLGLTYDRDSSSHTTLGLSAWGGGAPTRGDLASRFRGAPGSPGLDYLQPLNEYGQFGSVEISPGYTKQFHRPKQELRLLGQASYLYDRSRYETRQRRPADEAPLYGEQGSSRSCSPQWSVQADYAHPFTASGQQVLEGGVKLLSRHMRNEYQAAATPPGFPTADLQPNATRSNDFRYLQQVLAAYTSLKLQPAPGWQLQAGARVEHTRQNGAFAAAGPAGFRTAFTNLLPSALLSWQLTEQHALKLSYAQRITRPEVWDLTPYVDASDPLNQITGNPLLRPELTHLTELGYDLALPGGATLATALYHRQTNNAIEQVREVGELGVARLISQNVAGQQRTGLNATFSWEPGEGWTLSGGAEAYYAHLSSPALQLRNSGWRWSGSLNVGRTLPSGYSVQASGLYQNGDLLLQGRTSAWYTHSLAVRKEFKSGRSSLTLNLDNPFAQPLRQRELLAGPTFLSQTDARYYARTVRLTFGWQLGQPPAEASDEAARPRPGGPRHR